MRFLKPLNIGNWKHLWWEQGGAGSLRLTLTCYAPDVMQDAQAKITAEAEQTAATLAEEQRAAAAASKSRHDQASSSFRVSPRLS